MGKGKILTLKTDWCNVYSSEPYYIKHINPFLQKLSLTILQQTVFENIVTKGDIAHHEQFRLLPQCFQLFSIDIHAFFAEIISESFAADLLFVGKG